MVTLKNESLFFKRAIILSLTAHVVLLLLFIISPHLPSSSKKGMVHYVNMVSFPGGGGSGGGGKGSGGGGKGSGAPEGKKEGGGEETVETEVSQPKSLQDLTTPQNLQEQHKSSLRHPTKEVKEEKKSPPEKKKSVIQKKKKSSSQSSSQEKKGSSEGKGTGSGSGVRVGIGAGSGEGGGLGSGLSSQIGLSSFPYTYYLQVIIDRVSGNWFQSGVSPGNKENFHTTVYFKIHRNGQISGLNVEESSGIKSLDLTALRAIRSSAPFPPLPREYKEDYLGIHLIFEHKK